MGEFFYGDELRDAAARDATTTTTRPTRSPGSAWQAPRAWDSGNEVPRSKLRNVQLVVTIDNFVASCHHPENVMDLSYGLAAFE